RTARFRRLRREQRWLKNIRPLKHRRLSQQEVFAPISRPTCLFSRQLPRVEVLRLSPKIVRFIKRIIE
uniref:Uncharacterized protein n=1 Tax=Poecilia formosa TaxID=48698 RepID=A0A096LSB7_POEFO